MLLALVLALTLVINIIVQVLKSLLYDMLPHQPAGLPGGRSRNGRGGLRPVVLLPLCHHRLMIWLIALIFLVAFSAMFGYDKLVQLMEQAGWIKAQK